MHRLHSDVFQCPFNDPLFEIYKRFILYKLACPLTDWRSQFLRQPLSKTQWKFW